MPSCRWMWRPGFGHVCPLQVKESLQLCHHAVRENPLSFSFFTALIPGTSEGCCWAQVGLSPCCLLCKHTWNFIHLSSLFSPDLGAYCASATTAGSQQKRGSWEQWSVGCRILLKEGHCFPGRGSPSYSHHTLSSTQMCGTQTSTPKHTFKVSCYSHCFRRTNLEKCQLQITGKPDTWGLLFSVLDITPHWLDHWSGPEDHLLCMHNENAHKTEATVIQKHEFIEIRSV